MRLNPVALPLAICVALASAPASSANHRAIADPVPDDAQQLPVVEVTANIPAVELDKAGTTTIITRQQMDLQLVTTIRDLVRYEPGVSAIGVGGRFGLDSFNIRGLSGNRTYMEIDGVPMAGSFGADVASGGFRAGRNYIDLSEIRHVEILRGPISALYPADALGGSVILTTRDPADYLQPGRHSYLSVKEKYDGSDRSWSTSATLAAGDKRNGFLLTANHRDGHETGNMGDIGGTGATRTRPDPMDYRLDSLLGKYVHTARSGRVDRITMDVSRRRTQSNGLSQLAPESHTGYVPEYYRSRDTSKRMRASVGQWFPSLGNALMDTLDWHAYWQQSRTHTHTETDGSSAARFYDSCPVDERVLGIKALAVKHLGTGSAVEQTLSYGVSASRTHVQSWADGYGIDKQTGEVGKTRPFVSGDYPMHLIPQSHTWRYAVFAQDRIAFDEGRLEVTPGLRAERYAYKPKADALYLKANTGYVEQNYTTHHWSPKLGVIWHFTDALSVFADYADGYRPPLYSELAGSWNEQPVPGFNIAFLPSPNLKAETSDNIELGLRGQGASGWFNLAVYRNVYHDFIWSGHALPAAQVPEWAHQIAPGAGYSLFFQSVNAKRAVIRGIEASGHLELGTISNTLDGWSLRASASIASGKLIEPGDTGYSPLNSVDPAKLVVGIGYEAANWGGQLIGTGVRRHTRLSDPNDFRPGGYATFDLYLHWKPVHDVTLYLGANNLTDRKYWNWGSLNSGMLGNFLSGNGVNDAGTGGLPADRLTMPGRTFSAAIRVTF